MNDTVVFAAEVLILKEATESRSPAADELGKAGVDPVVEASRVAQLEADADAAGALRLSSAI